MEAVTIRSSQTGAGTITNAEGYFEMQVTQLPETFTISYLGYEPQIISITDSLNQELVIRMKTTFANLPEISVTSRRKIDTVFQESYSVVEYQFMEDYLVLLAYKNSFQKYSLIILDADEAKIAELSLLDKTPRTIYKACDQKVYLCTDFFAYEISVVDNTIKLNKKKDIQTFEAQMFPCVLSTPDFFYFSRYYFQDQALRYFVQDKNEPDSALQKEIYLVQDEVSIDRLVEDAGVRMPYSGDIWQEEVHYPFEMLRESKYSLEGFMAITYPRINVQIFDNDTSLCIFNHVGNQLTFINERGEVIYRAGINYHKNKKWKKRIFYDAIQDRAYTSFNTRWGEEVCEIDLSTGNLSSPIPIEKAFIENPKAHKGYLYFVYRNTNSPDRNKILHKIKVN